jgi:hypothetical protein
MKKSLRVPLAMPVATALCALVVLAVVVGLTGCTDKHIAEVKAQPFSYPSDSVQDPNLTVDQALDYRKVCDSVKWKVDMTEQHQKFVEYQCDYKNVEHSAFVANVVLKAKVERGDKANGEDIVHMVHAGDVYQWTYGPNGSPALSYVAMRLHYSNGTSKDILTPEPYDTTRLMKAAAENIADDFDHIYAAATYKQIPPMPTADTETALRKEYDRMHPRVLSATDLAQLFSPKVIGLPASQYELLVGKFAGKAVTSSPLDDGTAEQKYQFADCAITANTGQGKVLGVTVSLDGSCPVTDADMPSYLQGKQWDWSKLTVKDVNDLASKTVGDQTLICASPDEIGKGACAKQGARLTTAISGSQADGFIDTVFTSRADDMGTQMAINQAMLALRQRNHLTEEQQLIATIYNKDPAFMKDIMGQLNVDSVSTLTLQLSGLSGRNSNVYPSQSMASTATPQPPPASAPAVAPAVAASTAAATEASKSGDVGPDGWPKMTPCIEKLQEKFTIDQQKQNADTSTSLEQMQEWADVCKSLGQ